MAPAGGRSRHRLKASASALPDLAGKEVGRRPGLFTDLALRRITPEEGPAEAEIRGTVETAHAAGKTIVLNPAMRRS